ncbi:MAG: HNH endonuclease [Methylacidiphilales bacterium]|nr:HNH endonuclease [Candidatus Methylacidiphilales bacterium]
MASYQELLLSPHWQRKRLAILNRSDFKCESCGSGEKTLHVHHTFYESGRKPWEYPDDSLVALCKDCHLKKHMVPKTSDESLYPLEEAENQALRGYRAGLWSYTEQDLLFTVLDYEHAQGVADWWGLPVDVVIADLKDSTTCGRALLALVARHGSPRKPWLERYAKGKQEA